MTDDKENRSSKACPEVGDKVLIPRPTVGGNRLGLVESVSVRIHVQRADGTVGHYEPYELEPAHHCWNPDCAACVAIANVRFRPLAPATSDAWGVWIQGSDAEADWYTYVDGTRCRPTREQAESTAKNLNDSRAPGVLWTATAKPYPLTGKRPNEVTNVSVRGPAILNPDVAEYEKAKAIVDAYNATRTQEAPTQAERDTARGWDDWDDKRAGAASALFSSPTTWLEDEALAWVVHIWRDSLPKYEEGGSWRRDAAKEILRLRRELAQRSDNPPPIKVTAEPPPYCEGADKHDWTVWCRECGAIDDSRAKALDYPIHDDREPSVLAGNAATLERACVVGWLEEQGHPELAERVDMGEHVKHREDAPRSDSVTTPEKKP